MRRLIHGLLAAGVLLGIPGTVLAAEGAPAVDTGEQGEAAIIDGHS